MDFLPKEIEDIIYDYKNRMEILERRNKFFEQRRRKILWERRKTDLMIICLGILLFPVFIIMTIYQFIKFVIRNILS